MSAQSTQGPPLYVTCLLLCLTIVIVGDVASDDCMVGWKLLVSVRRSCSWSETCPSEYCVCHRISDLFLFLTGWCDSVFLFHVILTLSCFPFTIESSTMILRCFMAVFDTICTINMCIPVCDV